MNKVCVQKCDSSLGAAKKQGVLSSSHLSVAGGILVGDTFPDARPEVRGRGRKHKFLLTEREAADADHIACRGNERTAALTACDQSRGLEIGDADRVPLPQARQDALCNCRLREGFDLARIAD